jgi:hypothetical protein
MLKKKLDKVEKNQAELYHSLEEKKASGLMTKISDKFSLGGIIEVEASALPPVCSIYRSASTTAILSQNR